MLNNYYSLDECFTKDEVYEHLEKLEDDGKISFDTVDTDVIKLKDEGLSPKEIKELSKFLEDNDVIQYNGFEADEEDDEDYEEENDEDYDEY